MWLNVCRFLIRVKFNNGKHYLKAMVVDFNVMPSAAKDEIGTLAHHVNAFIA
ncbi:hypothetical protein OK016_22990 [Vibrio chagasii]|nr:hypothetical protein [Vibrio chagasii]